MAELGERVVLYDYNRFKKILKEADPEIRKAMDSEIKSFLTPVSSLAKSRVPATVLSGWMPETEGKGRWASRSWDQAEVARKISVRQGGSRAKGSATSSAWKITNASAAGAIFELAGRKSTGHTPAGRTFVEMLMKRGGTPSRLIWRAWDDSGGSRALTRGVVEIINRYEHELTQRLN